MNIPSDNCMYEHTSDSRYLFIRHALASLRMMELLLYLFQWEHYLVQAVQVVSDKNW